MEGKKKLTLSKETLRLLDDSELAEVAGGGTPGPFAPTRLVCGILKGPVAHSPHRPPGTIVSITCYYTSCASIC